MQVVTAGCNCLKSRETEGITTLVCMCIQDKQVPGPFSVCSLSQPLVLAVAKAQPSSNLHILFLLISLYKQMQVIAYWKQIVNYQTIKPSICLLDWLSNSPINYNSTNY